MSVLKDIARKGLPFHGELLIDSHNHMGGSFRNFVPYTSVEEVIANMDRIGIDKACACTLESGSFADNKRHNDIVADYVRKSQGRILGYATLNCNYKNEVLDEILRCESNGLNLGIKMHIYGQDYKIDDGFLIPIYEHINRRKAIILHHYFGEPERLEPLIKEFSDITFIAGHLIMSYADLAKKYENFYINTCATLAFGEVKELTSKIGSEKILYGSDFVALDSTFGYGPVAFADITDEEKRNILGRNMKKIIDRINN